MESRKRPRIDDNGMSRPMTAIKSQPTRACKLYRDDRNKADGIKVLNAWNIKPNVRFYLDKRHATNVYEAGSHVFHTILHRNSSMMILYGSHKLRVSWTKRNDFCVWQSTTLALQENSSLWSGAQSRASWHGWIVSVGHSALPDFGESEYKYCSPILWSVSCSPDISTTPRRIWWSPAMREPLFEANPSQETNTGVELPILEHCNA